MPKIRYIEGFRCEVCNELIILLSGENQITCKACGTKYKSNRRLSNFMEKE